MKCSLGISNFLEEISSVSHSVVFLYFFALITEEGFLISSCYSLELCIQTLINMLFRLVITFLPRSKRLLISWLQSPSAVILEPPKNKVWHWTLAYDPIKNVKNIPSIAGCSGKWFTVYIMYVNDLWMLLRKQTCCEKVLYLFNPNLAKSPQVKNQKALKAHRVN